MSRRQRSRTTTELEPGEAAAPAPAAPPATLGPPPSGELDPLYGVALLKIALELKRQRERSPEEILRGVLARMRLSEAEFRDWLSHQGELAKVFGRP